MTQLPIRVGVWMHVIAGRYATLIRSLIRGGCLIGAIVIGARMLFTRFKYGYLNTRRGFIRRA